MKVRIDLDLGGGFARVFVEDPSARAGGVVQAARSRPQDAIVVDAD